MFLFHLAALDKKEQKKTLYYLTTDWSKFLMMRIFWRQAR